MNEYKLFFDGGCIPYNPGGIGTWSFIIKDKKKKIIEKQYGLVPDKTNGIPQMTNNVAEWYALQQGLDFLFGTNCKLQIFGDSMLVISQLTKRWKSKTPYLSKFRDHCLYLLEGKEWTAEWIPRHLNGECDVFTNSAYEEYIKERIDS